MELQSGMEITANVGAQSTIYLYTGSKQANLVGVLYHILPLCNFW